MTRATIITITTLIWSAGFAATGAFVYTVTKPLPTSAVAATPPTTSPPRMPHSQERTIVLTPVEIIGDIPHASPPRSASVAAVRATTAVAKTTTTTTDATKTETETPHERHCSEWRPLEQGSNSVQICD
jgi:hypothetical protein